MIFGEFNKEELKIAKKLIKKLEKLHYKEVSIRRPIPNGLFVVAGIEPLGKKVISVTLTINDMKNKLRI